MERLYEGMSVREITEFLFVEDDPEAADLIFVFGGKRQERALRAAELYRQGYAPKIWVSGGDKRKTGTAEAEVLKRTMMEQGVPEAAILLETASADTIENVVASHPLIEKAFGWKNFRKVILVSSPMHMRRVKRAFARHCPPETKIICCPDGRTDIARDNWWQTPEGRREVLRELEKVRSYALKGEL